MSVQFSLNACLFHKTMAKEGNEFTKDLRKVYRYGIFCLGIFNNERFSKSNSSCCSCSFASLFRHIPKSHFCKLDSFKQCIMLNNLTPYFTFYLLLECVHHDHSYHLSLKIYSLPQRIVPQETYWKSPVSGRIVAPRSHKEGPVNVLCLAQLPQKGLSGPAPPEGPMHWSQTQQSQQPCGVIPGPRPP